MARYIGPKCKLSRREGTDLFLKSRVRALETKCNLEKAPGSHGDKRRRAEWIEPIRCCVGMVGSIADGEAEVRKAVREQLRRDVNQIKIMASGGAMSPSDELDTTQYTVGEMRAGTLSRPDAGLKRPRPK